MSTLYTSNIFIQPAHDAPAPPFGPIVRYIRYPTGLHEFLEHIFHQMLAQVPSVELRAAGVRSLPMRTLPSRHLIKETSVSNFDINDKKESENFSPLLGLLNKNNAIFIIN